MLRTNINLDDIDSPSLICDNSGRVIKVNNLIKDIATDELLIKFYTESGYLKLRFLILAKSSSPLVNHSLITFLKESK